MTISTNHQQTIFNKTLMKEYAVGLTIALYPACKIKKLCDFAFSEDGELDDAATEDRQAMQVVSVATSAIGSLYIAFFAQRVLGLLRKRKIRPLVAALAITLPHLIERYPALKEKLKDHKFSELNSRLVTGSIAVTALIATTIVAKKIL